MSSAERCGHGSHLGAAPSAARSPAGSETSARSREPGLPRGSVLIQDGGDGDVPSCTASGLQPCLGVLDVNHTKLPPSFSCFYISHVSRLLPEASRKSHIIFSHSQQCLFYTHKHISCSRNRLTSDRNQKCHRHLRQTQGRHTGPGMARAGCTAVLLPAALCSPNLLSGPCIQQDLQELSLQRSSCSDW